MRALLGVLLSAGLLAGCSGHSGHSEPVAAPVVSATSTAAHEGHTAVAPTEAPLPTRAGERLITVGVPRDFTPKAPTGATDEYRCFVIDPKLTQDTSITGTQFVPGNAAIVHHSILYVAYPEQVAAARALDAQDDQAGYECFGGSRLPARGDALSSLDQSDWITAWAPGGKSSTTPAGYGMTLPAGGAVVLQLHYNLAAEQGPDSTQVRLRVTDKKLKPLHTKLLAAPVELPCAPGQSGRLCDRVNAVDDVVSRFGAGTGATIAGLQMLCAGDPDNPKASDVQTCDRRVTTDSTIFAVAGHMHLLGRQISITLNPDTKAEKVLLDIDNWDFDQQAATPLRKPVKVEAGDVLRVRCRHDPTLRDQLPALQDTPDRYVVWGEGTADEMCLGIVVSG